MHTIHTTSAVEHTSPTVVATAGFFEHESRGGAAATLFDGQPPTHLLVDWTDERLCFHPSFRAASPPNAWLSLFEQPPRVATARNSPGRPIAGTAAADNDDANAADAADAADADASRRASLLDAAALKDADAGGGVRVSVCYGRPRYFGKLGDLIGADPIDNGEGSMRGGRLDEATAAAGRAAVAKWLVVRPPIERRAARLQAEALCARLPMSEWLAVHVRMSDKLVQCPQNRIAPVELTRQIETFCTALGCGGVFLCSCDAQLKRTLSAALTSGGLYCASLAEATLPASSELPPHMDAAIDARRNAEDCLVEVLVMSRCRGLLCTWSHVSVAAVYFSPPGYPFYMFGDAPPATATPMAAPAPVVTQPVATPSAGTQPSVLIAEAVAAPSRLLGTAYQTRRCPATRNPWAATRRWGARSQ